MYFHQLLKAAVLGMAYFRQVNADPLRYNMSLNSQVRSAYAGPHAITVSWNTYYELTPPIVHFGESKNALSRRASSDVSVTYPTSLTYNNHVRIEGLQPDTKYWYLPEHLINSTEAVGPFTFRTPRLIGDETPYSVALIVDMGAMGSEGLGDTAGATIATQDILMPGEQNTIQSLAKAVDSYDFVMHPGDLAYADTWLTEVNQGYLNATTDLEGGAKAYESILDDFYDQCTSFTQHVPYMTAPGNHEANCIDAAYDCPVGQTNFTGYENHFRMPSDVANQAPNNFGVGNMWYSYDNGMVHYIMLDMETDMPDYAEESFDPIQFGSYLYQQRDFLAADLAAVDRCMTPWIVVTGHRQWYSSSSDGQCIACQNIFEELFNEYQIDIYLSGHYHVYERQHSIGLNGTIDPKGMNDPVAPWYIINGIGGHYGGLNPFNVAKSPYQVYGLSILNATYGWSKLTFHNRTHLTHDFINSSSDAVLDTATLYKSHNFGAACKPVVLPSSTISSSTNSSMPAGASASGLPSSSISSNATSMPSTFLSRTLAVPTTSSSVSG
ncbi:Metallo-dependent phosphatase-like protein [Calycina marina]|uniref:Purple acid phosphatase n=1 Tax=Calycina marina TaxID=1763456 RepID=A0A9P7Z406_9HELO|nr:Metallo-dependent phosphatase-like protein [Calycina marina]